MSRNAVLWVAPEIEFRRDLKLSSHNLDIPRSSPRHLYEQCRLRLSPVDRRSLRVPAPVARVKLNSYLSPCAAQGTPQQDVEQG